MKTVNLEFDIDDSQPLEEIQNQIRSITDSRDLLKTLGELAQMPPESKSVTGSCSTEVDTKGNGK
ncbi:hypothetical protein QNE79_000773, partial [Vibrio alginolyticus]|nr:hypothetical protein [Vibrio alginolyticus]